MNILKNNINFLFLIFSFIFFVFTISISNYLIEEVITYLTAYFNNVFISEVYGTFLYYIDFVYCLEYSFISIILIRKLISNINIKSDPISWFFNATLGLILLPIFISFSNYFLDSFLNNFLNLDFFSLNAFSENLINNFYIIYILNFIFFIGSYIFSFIIKNRGANYGLN